MARPLKMWTMPLFWFAMVWVVSCSFSFRKTLAEEGDGIVVHVVPHSHTDPGWLLTSEDYYKRHVKKILDGVLSQLEADPERRFAWAETCFFERWYSEQKGAVKAKIARLVAEGQLEFVGGGWVQHDEALPTAEGILDQFEIGHTWLMRTFGVKPRIGWQLDPFGHSDATPSIFAALGYDALVINRIHSRKKSIFKSEKGMEFMWRGAKLDVAKSEIFTHVLYQHYASPKDFDFESKGVRGVTVPRRRAQKLVKEMQKRAAAYRTHNVLMMFGDDFRFQQAEKQFVNIEKLMRYINEKEKGITIRFSTPSEYFDAVHAAAAVTATRFPSYEGDFYPYSDDGKSYWTGYYTTRPNLKRSMREMAGLTTSAAFLFSIARQRAAVVGDFARPQRVRNGIVYADGSAEGARLFWGGKGYAMLSRARRISALMTHHDAITGTSRGKVVADYKKSIQKATEDVHGVIVESLAQLMTKRKEDFKASAPRVRPSLTFTPFRLSKAGLEGSTGGEPVHWQHPIVLHNAELAPRTELLQIRLRSPWHLARQVSVTDAEGKAVKAQVHAALVPEGDGAWTTQPMLSFVAQVPALGFTTYFVSSTSARQRVHLGGTSTTSVPIAKLYDMRDGAIRSTGGDGGNSDDGTKMMRSASEDAISIENAAIKVELDARTGLIHSITDKESRRRTYVKQSYGKYPSKSSGAYIFRPSRSSSDPIDVDDVTISVVKGSVIQEVRALIRTGRWQIAHSVSVLSSSSSPRASFRSQKQSGQPTAAAHHQQVYIQHSLAVAEDNCDAVVRYETNMRADGTFFTDNTLGEFRQRTSHKEAPKGSNFFPANSIVGLRDDEATEVSRLGQVLAFAASQPLGVASPSSKTGASVLEMVLHRRHASDDGRGLAEGVKDKSIATVDFRLIVASPTKGAALSRAAARSLQRPLMPLYAVEDSQLEALLDREAWASRFAVTASFAGSPALGECAELLSLHPADSASDDIVLRLRAKRGKKCTVDFSKLFASGVYPRHVDERPLTIAGSKTFQPYRFLIENNGASSLPSGVGMAKDDGAVFVSEFAQNEAAAARKPMALLPSGSLSTIPAGEFRAFVCSVAVLDTVKSISAVAGASENAKLPSKTAKTAQNAQKPKREKTAPSAQKAKPKPKPKQQARVSRTSQDVQEIDLLKKRIALKEKKMARIKGNIEELSEEVAAFGASDYSEEKQATLIELAKYKDEMKRLDEELKKSRASLDSQEQRARFTNTLPGDLPTIDKSQWGAEDAVVHGVVVGACGMLVVVILVQWTLKRASRRGRRGYVPVQYKSYLGAGGGPGLPAYGKRL